MDINKILEKFAIKLQIALEGIFGKKIDVEWCCRGCVVVACLVVSLVLCAVSNATGGDAVKEGTITRPEGYTQTLGLTVSLDGEKSQDISVEVAPRQYSEAELEENFARLEKELPEIIKGENESLYAVNESLNLTTYAENYGISIQWYSGNYERIRADGTVDVTGVDGDGELVMLTANLSCQNKKMEVVLPVKVICKDMTQAEKMNAVVGDTVQGVIDSQSNEAKVLLPLEIDGKKASYSETDDGSKAMIMLLGLLSAVGIILGRSADRKGKANRRQKELIYDYPELVSKLTLLTGAGMTVRRAFEKIASDYQRRRSEGGGVRPAYEELVITGNQMASGMPEGMAYVDFGRRCELKEYRKLGTLLEQNMRKGAKGLSLLLEQESAESFEQRKNCARQQGEEAGTKLLLPMIMMLLVVMVIIMFPAVMSFQI